MNDRWSRWKYWTGTTRQPIEAPDVVLSVDLEPPDGLGAGFRWRFSLLVRDPTVKLGARLEDRATGIAPSIEAARRAAEKAWADAAKAEADRVARMNALFTGTYRPGE